MSVDSCLVFSSDFRFVTFQFICNTDGWAVHVHLVYIAMYHLTHLADPSSVVDIFCYHCIGLAGSEHFPKCTLESEHSPKCTFLRYCPLWTLLYLIRFILIKLSKRCWIKRPHYATSMKQDSDDADIVFFHYLVEFKAVQMAAVTVQNQRCKLSFRPCCLRHQTNFSLLRFGW